MTMIQKIKWKIFYDTFDDVGTEKKIFIGNETIYQTFNNLFSYYFLLWVEYEIQCAFCCLNLYYVKQALNLKVKFRQWF